MHVKREIDGHRFIDLKARDNGSLVHSVEISDGRSLSHFVTLFFRDRDPEVDGFVYVTGLIEDNHHDPKVYHRGDEKTRWVLETFPDKGAPWTHHWHYRLKRAPTLGDVARFREGMSPELFAEIEAHFKRKKR